MKKILILYATTDGHTKLICEKIQSALADTFQVELHAIQEINENLSVLVKDVERVIIGASIRYGKHSNDLYSFIENNTDFLETTKNAFFSVNVVARKPEKNIPETNPYIKKFLTISKWDPDELAVFAGKVDYPKYRLIDKYMIRLIMWITKGPTDISKTYEFTDWNKVEEFANKIKKNS
ncbi:MAG: menaquinone-dependent protoporphyrinogen IX dehydrogenase [Gammaproteobacteria bacterium]|nr:menaquinone-dependent protoporphyrinogen IX dehydrogenase [Gammaproteobacteria bacterium]